MRALSEEIPCTNVIISHNLNNSDSSLLPKAIMLPKINKPNYQKPYYSHQKLWKPNNRKPNTRGIHLR